MEAVKGVIFDRGKDEIEGRKVHKYLVTMMLITDEPLENIEDETIIMSVKNTNFISDGLSFCEKYKPPYCLGDCSNAILSVTEMKPSDLEKIENGEIK
jgi:hypothetical protein